MQLAIDDHISRLLFDHECVIVPGFGAFLTRYYSAEVNAATHMMRPPSRRLYFNRAIRENDGLLAKAISYTEDLSYDEALTAIGKKAQEWSAALKAGQKVVINGIGRLYVDEISGKLQFSPSLENNFLTSAYGLSIFRSPAVQREAQIRKGVHKAIEKHMSKKPGTREQAETKASTKKKKRTPWAAILLPLAFAGAVGAGYVAYQNDAFENVAGFNILEFSRSTEKPVEEPAVEENAEATAEESFEEEANGYDSYYTEEEEVAEESYSTSAPEASAEEQNLISGYHIVVGSFQDRENAQQYISELQAEGYEAYLADGDASFSRVAIGNFQSWGAAKNALDGVRQNINSGSWIYSN